MPLYDTPPHRVTVLRPTTGRDAGGGTTTVYAPVVSAVPCSIHTASASEVARFAAAQIRVTHTVAFLADTLSVGLLPGDVLQADDTAHRYRVQGIRAGRPYGHVPAFVYCDCEHLL